MKPEKQKHQKGYIFKSRRFWFGRWYRDELETQADGSKLVVRRHVSMRRSFASVRIATGLKKTSGRFWKIGCGR
jgi:hypothetical protein